MLVPSFSPSLAHPHTSIIYIRLPRSMRMKRVGRQKKRYTSNAGPAVSVQKASASSKALLTLFFYKTGIGPLFYPYYCSLSIPLFSCLFFCCSKQLTHFLLTFFILLKFLLRLVFWLPLEAQLLRMHATRRYSDLLSAANGC